jgi:hypothetical protein
MQSTMFYSASTSATLPTCSRCSLASLARTIPRLAPAINTSGSIRRAALALCVRESRPARPEEYAALAAELTTRGYVLNVIARATRKHYILRDVQIRSAQIEADESGARAARRAVPQARAAD